MTSSNHVVGIISHIIIVMNYTFIHHLRVQMIKMATKQL